MRKTLDAILALAVLLGILISLVALPFLLFIGAVALVWYCIFAYIHD